MAEESEVLSRSTADNDRGFQRSAQFSSDASGISTKRFGYHKQLACSDSNRPAEPALQRNGCECALTSAKSSNTSVLLSIFGALLAVLNFVQVPQWDVDWKECSVSVPDTACHWYVVDPDNTFGRGFSWITAPSFDPEGVRDIALQRQATEAQGFRTTVAWMDAGSDIPYGDDY